MTNTLDSPPDLSQLSRFRQTEPEPFEVRGRPGIHVVISVVAGVMALAYLWRAIDGGSPVLWLMVALLVGIATMHLLGRREAALPRLVADTYGVRVRQRAQWIGLPWDDLERVEVVALHGPLGPTSIRLVADEDDDPIVVRCGAATRTSPDDIVVALRALSGRRVPICRGSAPSEHALPSDAPERDDDEPPEAGDLTVAEETGSGRAVRAQVTRADSVTDLIPAQPEAENADRPAAQADVETEAAEAPQTRADDDEPDPPEVGRAPVIRAEVDSSIGPLLAAARFRARLSVDELGERTRIRPHVIEAIENDDFGPCGGDFYARGHLRSLCRVLGVDPEPLLATFDRRYARAPIEAREVFEAELATGPHPSLRTIGRPSNWVALLVAVMLLAIVWAVAKVVVDDEDAGAGTNPVPASSPNGADGDRPAEQAAPVRNKLTLRGVGDGGRVSVENADGKQVWSGRLRPGESHDVTVAGPVTLIAKNGGAIRLRLNGDDRGRLGKPGKPVTVTVGR